MEVEIGLTALGKGGVTPYVSMVTQCIYTGCVVSTSEQLGVCI